ncbi:Pycsar system effector family protein [Porphyrobacter sp. AAP82]|uniref:Pycsar system effector family protein n=1 Tax=Porphyrobacter sp. AAP82 TaxID=1248917 RepID=UPI000311407B|nr:Pycsar system effector family protein [Porphyrobacter sp. AAP82]
MGNEVTGAAAPKAAPSLPSPSGYSNHAIHLVRTAQQINLSLSQMADQKASILMGATFLVFTITVGQARNGELPWSLGMLALFAFISAMCAVFAVLPAVSSPAAAKLNNGKVNKLFFGTFTGLDEQEWIDSILAELHADETVFRTMLHDIYQNGQVLQRKKYRFLAYAYKSFMFGMCLTAITFVIEMAAHYV